MVRYQVNSGSVLFIGDNYVDEDAAHAADVHFVYEKTLKEILAE